jgi:hypothetical protein
MKEDFSIVDIKVYLINKYFNKDFTKFDELVSHKTIKDNKIEFINLTNVIFKSIKDNLFYFESLLIFNYNDKLDLELKSIKKVIKKMENRNKSYTTNLSNFINNYKIDMKEVDSLTLLLLSKKLNKGL